MLAELAVSRLDAESDWSDPEVLTRLQVADLACGTGTLLSAAYRALAARYRRTGGDDQALHRQMIEGALIAADIMPAATHLTASMVSSAHPGTTFGQTRVHALPYGEQSQEKRHRMALGALDLIEDNAAPSLFGTGATVAHGKGTDGVAKLSQEMNLPAETADLVIMNPPFTRPTNHETAKVPVPSFAGLRRKKDEQKAMAKRLAEVRQRLANPAGHGKRRVGFQLHRPRAQQDQTRWGPCARTPGLVCQRWRLGGCAPSIGSRVREPGRFNYCGVREYGIGLFRLIPAWPRPLSSPPGAATRARLPRRRCSLISTIGREASRKHLKWQGRYIKSRAGVFPRARHRHLDKEGCASETLKPLARTFGRHCVKAVALPCANPGSQTLRWACWKILSDFLRDSPLRLP